MSNSLTLDVGTVSSVARSLKNTGRYMNDEWGPTADFGSDAVASAVRSLATTLNDGLFGAATGVFSAGQGAADAVEVFQQLDRDL